MQKKKLNDLDSSLLGFKYVHEEIKELYVTNITTRIKEILCS